MLLKKCRLVTALGTKVTNDQQNQHVINTHTNHVHNSSQKSLKKFHSKLNDWQLLFYQRTHTFPVFFFPFVFLSHIHSCKEHCMVFFFFFWGFWQTTTVTFKGGEAAWLWSQGMETEPEWNVNRPCGLSTDAKLPEKEGRERKRERESHSVVFCVCDYICVYQCVKIYHCACVWQGSAEEQKRNIADTL